MPSPYPFVSESFVPPASLETKDYRLRMLTVNDVVKDFEAVMSSVDELGKVWPHGDWPEGLTLEADLVDLGWHQHEFLERRSFAYTVVTHDETKVLGCVYIYPTRKATYDVEVYSWMRETPLGTGIDADLQTVVKGWIASDWPFTHPAFPGREPDWVTWNTLPDQKR